MVYRLTGNHELEQKLQEIFELMSKYDISIEFLNHKTEVTFKNKKFDMLDIDCPTIPCNTIPPELEYKLTYE